ncbi:hypothetical protein HPB47_005586 [Ixodes persulcatus]|uniref:Uncharacterized protein n=1 Tax=Ixodes persulcatus TaxID=34615 RepID=A0AC60PCH3_IXOPE|nr:hypothetical protein HPB47_005586 [Ixodes persulcatus]
MTISMATHYEKTQGNLKEFAAEGPVPHVTERCRRVDEDMTKHRCYRSGSASDVASSVSCEARGAQCMKCKTVHFQSVCQSRTAPAVQDVKEDRETPERNVVLLNVMTDDGQRGIYIGLEVKAVNLRFVVDMESSVSILTKDVYQRWFHKRLSLAPSFVTLLDYSIRVEELKSRGGSLLTSGTRSLRLGCNLMW